MHSGAINREYKFKFYLNANHYIIIDGKEENSIRIRGNLWFTFE